MVNWLNLKMVKDIENIIYSSITKFHPVKCNVKIEIYIIYAFIFLF